MGVEGQKTVNQAQIRLSWDLVATFRPDFTIIAVFTFGCELRLCTN
jgi:hypothetical protein